MSAFGSLEAPDPPVPVPPNAVADSSPELLKADARPAGGLKSLVLNVPKKHSAGVLLLYHLGRDIDCVTPRF